MTLGGWACAQEAAAQVAATPNEPCANFAKTFTDCMSDSNGDLEACRCALCMEPFTCLLFVLLLLKVRCCLIYCCTGRAYVLCSHRTACLYGNVISFCAWGAQLLLRQAAELPHGRGGAHAAAQRLAVGAPVGDQSLLDAHSLALRVLRAANASTNPAVLQP